MNLIFVMSFYQIAQFTRWKSLLIFINSQRNFELVRMNGLVDIRLQVQA